MLGHINSPSIHHRLSLVVWYSINLKIVLHDTVDVASVRAMEQQQFFHLSFVVQSPLVVKEEFFLFAESALWSSGRLREVYEIRLEE